MRRLGGAMLAGAVAGAFVTVLQALARSLAGVPLPVELISDRVLPLIPVDTFLMMLGRFGGPIAAK